MAPVRNTVSKRAAISMSDTTPSQTPHGGALVNTVVPAAEREALVAETTATMELSERQACDVGLLMFGGFSPLTGFMTKADYDTQVETMRTKDGVLFGLPVVLDVADKELEGKKVLLTYKGTNLAVMDVEEVYEPDKAKEAKASFGTDSEEHPTVKELMNDLGKFYLGGKISGLVDSLEGVYGKGYK